MQSIGDFLQKFKNIKNESFDTRKVFSEILDEKLGILIDPKKIVLTDNFLIIPNLSSIAKNQVFIKKQALIMALKNRIPHTKVSDIK